MGLFGGLSECSRRPLVYFMTSAWRIQEDSQQSEATRFPAQRSRWISSIERCLWTRVDKHGSAGSILDIIEKFDTWLCRYRSALSF